MENKDYEQVMALIGNLAKNTNDLAIISKDSIKELADTVNARFNQVDSRLIGVEVSVGELAKQFDCITLQNADIDRITKAKNIKIVSLLGGKDSNSYNSAKDGKGKCIRSRAYSDIAYQINREFGVSNYKFIKSNQTQMVLDFIARYELPYELKEAVDFANRQMRLDL